MTHRTVRAVLVSVVTAAVLAAAGACGKVEGGIHWRELAEEHHGAAVESREHEVFPVPRPPFTEGAFPCSRCHEGGSPAKDELPAMPHKLHVGRGIECADCHQDGDAAAEPKIPAREVCDTCHGDPEKLSAGAKAYFASVATEDGATKFPKRWKTRDAEPKHTKHLAAGVACASCHGEPQDTPFAKPKPVTLMERCVACHEERQKTQKCESCHRDTTEKAHAKIVLHHAEEQRGCLDCHDAEDRDLLHLSNGAKIPFEESFKLCGQCHGTQYRDWKIGLHGKRTGEWNGRREYRLCVHCHWPHEPRIQPMVPVALPARPEEVR